MRARSPRAGNQFAATAAAGRPNRAFYGHARGPGVGRECATAFAAPAYAARRTRRRWNDASSRSASRRRPTAMEGAGLDQEFLGPAPLIFEQAPSSRVGFARAENYSMKCLRRNNFRDRKWTFLIWVNDTLGRGRELFNFRIDSSSTIILHWEKKKLKISVKILNFNINKSL